MGGHIDLTPGKVGSILGALKHSPLTKDLAFLLDP